MSTICQILCQVLGIAKEVGVLLLKELTGRPEQGLSTHDLGPAASTFPTY